MAQIAKAHNNRVTEAEGRRELLKAEEDSKVADAEAKLAAAQAHRDGILAALDEELATFRAEAAAADKACADFRQHVAAHGIEDLDISQVHELLLQLGTVVSLQLLQEQGVTGSVLSVATEDEFLSEFKILTLGERRRLALAIRRLHERGGFEAAGTLDWDVERVCAWLDKEGMSSFASNFKEHQVDGLSLIHI